MDKSIEEKYNILSTKIADIRNIIPIGWFDDKDGYALTEAVARDGHYGEYVLITK